MNEICDNQKTCIVKMLDIIRNQDIRDSISVSQLASEISEEFKCENCIMIMLRFLKVFGVIEIYNEELNPKVSIKSLSAKYFMMSYLEFIKSEQQLFNNWDDSKGVFPEVNKNNLLCGPNFLYYMELRRKNISKDCKPLNKIRSARAIIKAHFVDEDIDKFLFQYDQKTYEYKIIGGEVESYDKDDVAAINREIKEELHKSNLIYNENYSLDKVQSIKKDYMSKKYGAFLSIDLVFYFVNIHEADALVLGRDDCWISKEEISNRKTNDGKAIFEIEKDILDKMDKLPLSITFEKTENKKNKNEMLNKSVKIVIGVIIGIAGLLAAFGDILSFFNK